MSEADSAHFREYKDVYFKFVLIFIIVYLIFIEVCGDLTKM